MTQPQHFDPDLQALRDQRTYCVSDERLRAEVRL